MPKIEGCNDRGIEVVYHLRSAANWRTMLTRALINAWRPAGEGVPLQTVTIISNAGEWFEGGGLDDTAPDASGRCRFPWNSCGALLDVVAEEDRYVE